MPFDSSFASSSASEFVFFAVWIATGITALVFGAALVVRANRVFRRRQIEVGEGHISASADDERARHALPTAA
jgi:hypothetical protein